MPARVSSVLLLSAAALALPLGAAGPAAASAKFRACTQTANKGEQVGIRVRAVTCANAVNFLNAIATLPPTSVKDESAATVATLKTRGWVCVVRVPKPDPNDPSASRAAHGTCTANKKRAIRWRTR